MTRPLLATYRVQFNAAFTFADAERLVPYWSMLGISHLYASPIFAARDGSTHGYDIVDHGAISPLLGGADGLRQLSTRLRDAGMGLILDIVPNHAGIGGDQNKIWLNLLEFGPLGEGATFFDVDWREGKILVPVLADPIGQTLSHAALHPEWHAKTGRLALRYESHLLPLSPKTVCRLLIELAGPGQHGELCSMAVDWLAHHEGKSPGRSLTELRLRLRDVLNVENRSGQLLGLLAAELRADTPTESQGTAPQTRLLNEQYWRLAHWRTARDELNYRRFFSISDLAAIRVEDQEVFQAIHALPLQLLGDGVIDGLRIDHIDGLADPMAYCLRLREATGETPTIHVEKILGAEETLRPWPIDGTTGYETLNLINGLFIDAGGYAQLAEHAGSPRIETRIVAAKRQILFESFVTELEQLAHLAKRLADRSQQTRDLTHEALKRALTELLAEFPLYRSYLTDAPCDPLDRETIETLVVRLKTEAQPWQKTVFDFLQALLLQSDADALPFKRRFQHLSAPLMAKGYEDTELYRAIILVSANEVGGHIWAPTVDTAEFHRRAAQQLQHWPKALIPLATHDTKRGADMRARLNVLSDYAGPWIEMCQKWSAAHQRFRSDSRDQRIPSMSDEMLIYQTLAGCWPIELERLLPYIEKAIREARVHGNWEDPDVVYEQGVTAFVKSLIDSADGTEFPDGLSAFLQPVIASGRIHAIAQTIIQFTMPGVPDLYWGGEFWDLSLVDPDNRRPVDWDARMRAVEAMPQAKALSAAEIVVDETGAIKLTVIARLLALRRDCPRLFLSGGYVPLVISSPAGDPPWLAYIRDDGNDGVLVVVPLRSTAHGDNPLIAQSMLALPNEWAGKNAQNLFSGQALELTGEVTLATLLQGQPVAVLRRI